MSPIFIIVYCFIVAGILELICPGNTAYLNQNKGCSAAIIIFSAPIWILAIWLNLRLFQRIRSSMVLPWQVLLIALTTHLGFACVYWSAYIIGASNNSNIAMNVFGDLQPQNGTITGPLHIEAYISFVYFALTTGTTTGFGDISVEHWSTDIICSVQMIVSAIYTVGLFTISMSQFQVYERVKSDPTKQLSGVDICFKKCRALPFMSTFRAFVIKWTFVLSFFIQLV
jgi:hypothetical protein